MDTSSFFVYPGEPEPTARPGARPFLADASDDEWDRLVEHMQTVRFAAGDVLLRAGEDDAAAYLLLAGRVAVTGATAVLEAPAVLGEGAFFDGLARAREVRALSAGEALRLGREGFEALAARQPRLARLVLQELGAVLAERARGDRLGFTG